MNSSHNLRRLDNFYYSGGQQNYQAERYRQASRVDNLDGDYSRDDDYVPLDRDAVTEMTKVKRIKRRADKSGGTTGKNYYESRVDNDEKYARELHFQNRLEDRGQDYAVNDYQHVKSKGDYKLNLLTEVFDLQNDPNCDYYYAACDNSSPFRPLVLYANYDSVVYSILSRRLLSAVSKGTITTYQDDDIKSARQITKTLIFMPSKKCCKILSDYLYKLRSYIQNRQLIMDMRFWNVLAIVAMYRITFGSVNYYVFNEFLKLLEITKEIESLLFIGAVTCENEVEMFRNGLHIIESCIKLYSNDLIEKNIAYSPSIGAVRYHQMYILTAINLTFADFSCLELDNPLTVVDAFHTNAEDITLESFSGPDHSYILSYFNIDRISTFIAEKSWFSKCRTRIEPFRKLTNHSIVVCFEVESLSQSDIDGLSSWMMDVHARHLLEIVLVEQKLAPLDECISVNPLFKSVANHKSFLRIHADSSTLDPNFKPIYNDFVSENYILEGRVDKPLTLDVRRMEASTSTYSRHYDPVVVSSFAQGAVAYAPVVNTDVSSIITKDYTPVRAPNSNHHYVHTASSIPIPLPSSRKTVSSASSNHQYLNNNKNKNKNKNKRPVPVQVHIKSIHAIPVSAISPFQFTATDDSTKSCQNSIPTSTSNSIPKRTFIEDDIDSSSDLTAYEKLAQVNWSDS